MDDQNRNMKMGDQNRNIEEGKQPVADEEVSYEDWDDEQVSDKLINFSTKATMGIHRRELSMLPQNSLVKDHYHKLHRSMLHRSDESMLSQTSEVNDHYVRHIYRSIDWPSTFNCGALELVLGSYGLVLSNPLFWMCWSILVVKVVSYWEWIEGFTRSSCESEGTTWPHTPGANILKLGMSTALITLLLSTQDITQRQNIMLLIIAISVILFEGVMPLLRGIECQKLKGLKTLKALIPCALNAMMSMTGPIVLGGDLGYLMRKQAWWGFTFIFLVDGLAEFFPRIVRHFSFVRFSKIHHVVVVLRLIVEGSLCCWMGKVIYECLYFPSNLGIDDCNNVCQERSKHLLITMVALGGLQAAIILCCFPAYQQCPLLPS